MSGSENYRLVPVDALNKLVQPFRQTGRSSELLELALRHNADYYFIADHHSLHYYERMLEKKTRRFNSRLEIKILDRQSSKFIRSSRCFYAIDHHCFEHLPFTLILKFVEEAWAAGAHDVSKFK